MIQLIVDSTFGLTDEYIEKNHIHVVSLNLILDDKTTKEGGVNNWQEFYGRLEASKNFPKTSQPSPQDFMDAMTDIFEKNPNDEILVLTISEYLSGTINSAILASKSFEGKKVVVMDSKQATVGSQVLCEAVVEKMQTNCTLAELVTFVEQTIPKVHLYFLPATMEYLKRGGRIGTLSATLASVLSIKPIFSFKEGRISVSKKVLGFGKALSDMIALLPKEVKKIYVCYIHNTEHVAVMVEKVKQAFGLKNVEVMPVGPVFGSHVGIGAVGIAALEF